MNHSLRFGVEVVTVSIDARNCCCHGLRFAVVPFRNCNCKRQSICSAGNCLGGLLEFDITCSVVICGYAPGCISRNFATCCSFRIFVVTRGKCYVEVYVFGFVFRLCAAEFSCVDCRRCDCYSRARANPLQRLG